MTVFVNNHFYCCKQSLTRLFHPPTYPTIHPPIQDYTFFSFKAMQLKTTTIILKTATIIFQAMQLYNQI